MSSKCCTMLYDKYSCPIKRLSGAQRVIIIGHGPGSQYVMDLLERRCTSPLCLLNDFILNADQAVGIMRAVKAVVQVVGHSAIPVTPRNSEDLTEWYRKVY
jgi:histone deacetylase 6